VFNNDIERLLKMEDMWKHRRPPTPINSQSAEALMKEAKERMQIVDSTSGIDKEKKLRDQRTLGLGDNIDLLFKR
jgi:ubiquitin-like 1-activating enzyme E1 B